MTSQTKRNHSETFNAKEFYDLCGEVDEEEDFDRIRQWLNTNKDDNNSYLAALTYQGYLNATPILNISYKLPPLDIIQIIVKYAPEVLKMKDDTGVLPIHLACESRVSLEVIQALITASPDTIKDEDNKGLLPLHWACREDASLDILNFLIESYPEGRYQKDKLGRTPLFFVTNREYAMETDDNGMLLLHHACNNGYSYHLIRFLIQAYPKSIKIKDNHGRTPFHYYTSFQGRQSYDEIIALLMDSYGYLPIHSACYYGASLEVIQALITASPDTIKIEDSRGWLPIHWACFNHAAPNVLNLLIESYTEGMYHKDKLGRTPLDCLKDKKHAEKKDDNGMLAVHHTCKMGYSISLVCFLIQAYPESITFPDNEGRTPFQYIQVVSSEKDESGMLLLHRQAADSKWLSVGMLQILCDAYPESIQLKDKFGLLPIHYAYLNEWTSIDTLMFLLTRYPESVLSCDSYY